jgi:hypothetical protein
MGRGKTSKATVVGVEVMIQECNMSFPYTMGEQIHQMGHKKGPKIVIGRKFTDMEVH